MNNSKISALEASQIMILAEDWANAKAKHAQNPKSYYYEIALLAEQALRDFVNELADAK
jgi:hypothetical protein